MVKSKTFHFLLITLLFFSYQTMVSQEIEEKWHVVFNTGQTIPVEEIDYIMTTENDFDRFTVLTKDGTQYSDIASIKFEMMKPTSIVGVDNENPEIVIHGNLIQITNAGYKNGAYVAVVDLSGRSVASSKIVNGTAEVSIEKLAQGVYILSVGERNLKFRKQ